jgi:uncharacterized membrane protein YgcG
METMTMTKTMTVRRIKGEGAMAEGTMTESVMTAGMRTLRFLVRLVLVVVALLCLGAGGASAQEVPAGTATVRIPVVLPTDAAIAGGEIGFTQTAGLEYEGFIPALGVQNPVKTTVGQTTYVGFFSADNRYQPSAGGLVMGDLEFAYVGDVAEEVVLQEIRLHTRVNEGVDTQTLSPDTVYSVTRASGGGGGSDGSGGSGGGTNSGNDGAGGGSDNNSGTGGSSWNGWGTVADNDGEALTDEDGNVVVELSPDASVAPGASNGSSSASASAGDAGNAAIEGVSAPLAAGPANSDTGIAIWRILAALVALALVALFVVLWRRRRQKEAKNRHSQYS